MTEPDAILKAFKKVKRRDFLPAEVRKYADYDAPLHIGFNQTNSQPTTVAIMLRLLNVKPGDKVLDVGSGSGWTTALLAYLTGEKGSVIGVEIIPQLVDFGRKNLAKYPYIWARIVPAEKGILGYPSEAPYDKILVSASAQEVPQELVDQLKLGGRMVVPVGHSVYQVDKLPVDDKPYDLKLQEFPGFAFVPLMN